MATSDPIGDIIGDYRAFAAQQRDRLASRGIDISSYELSHLAYRVAEWDEYVRLRGLIERHAVANRENVWERPPIGSPMLDDCAGLHDHRLRERRSVTLTQADLR